VSTSGVILGGRYELHRRIGAGGYSEVWQATDLVLGRVVAVKLLYAGFAEHAETRTRFRAEGRRAGALSHENIARVYDFCEPPDPDLPFLVMELIDGPSVADLLRSGPLEQPSTARIIAQTAAGLDAAHRAGLIHRDIKPANLLISPGGVVKITDFGISDAADSAPITAANLLIGTPAYLAPERVTGVRATQATDLYALGIVGYECLTGSLPFDGHGMQVAMAHRERPLPALPESVDPDLAALITGLAAKDPAARPFSAADVACRAGQIADRMEAEAGVLAAPAARASAGVAASETVPDVAAATETQAASASTTAQMPLTEDVPGPPPVWRWPGRRVVLLGAAAAVVLIAGVVIASVFAAQRPPSATAGPSSPAHSAGIDASTVEVSSKALVGLPVSLVVQQLNQQGLKAHVISKASSAQAPGRVVDVRPTGRLPSGSQVTVIGATRPATANQPAAGNGNGRGKGNGNGGGDGQGDG
jgi:eukaryotic-like serine/threonine-protein kinase